MLRESGRTMPQNEAGPIVIITDLLSGGVRPRLPRLRHLPTVHPPHSFAPSSCPVIRHHQPARRLLGLRAFRSALAWPNTALVR